MVFFRRKMGGIGRGEGKDGQEPLKGESTYTLDDRAVASGAGGDDSVAVLQIGVGFLALDDHLGAAECIAG